MTRNKRDGSKSKSIAEIIKNAREDAGYSKSETARKIDQILESWGETGRITSRQCLYRVEQGRRRLDAVELLAIAALFKIKLDGFLYTPSSHEDLRD